MLLDFGIFLGVYLGIKHFRKYNNNNNTQKSVYKSVKSVKETQNTLVKGTVIKKIPDDNETPEYYNHYLKTSTFAMGLVAISHFFTILIPLSIGVYAYTSFPLFQKTEKSLKAGKIGNDVLTAVIILTCLATQQYFALTVSAWFYYLAHKMLAKTKDQSKNKLIDMFEQLPSQVWILKGEVEIEIPLSALKADDIVVVNTGEVIPIDGIITYGQAMIDQHALTGESQPVEKGQGDRIFASTVVITGTIFVQLEKTGEETTIAKIGQILNQSTEFKTNFQSKVEKWADRAVIPILGFTALSLPFLHLKSATAVLNSGFGNRIIATTPLGTLNYISLASHKGILIKNGQAIETLNQVDTILFDKTGTLTEEQPQVGQIILGGDYTENEVLIYAAAIECKLKHPIAKAIVQKAEQSNLILPEIDDSKYQIGYGISAEMNNQMIQVGSVRFMKMEGIDISEKIAQTIDNSHNNGFSLVMVAIDRQLIGVIEIQPSIRPEIKQIIHTVRQYGIKQLVIVSGDHKQPTQKLAEYLGMDDYFYEVLPEHKAKIVEQLQKEGRTVCFIGDGINDAIAIKQADVSISIHGASSIATDLAQIVFMNGNLSNLIELLDISKRLNSHFKSSLIINAVPTVIVISGAFLLHFNMMGSVIINITALLASLGNAMLPLLKIKSHEGKKT